MDSTYPRWQEQRIRQALEIRRVLVLGGPRQCGKTTLVRGMEVSGSVYHTLDDATRLAAAESDPRGFVRHGDELMIIDEVQRAPTLLTAIKQDVDENKKPGRFLLTGSANIQSLPAVRESLAGRIRKLRLRPLSEGEMFNKTSRFLNDAFKGAFHNFELGDLKGLVLDKDEYIKTALRGGYPEARALESPREVRAWHRDYVDTLIDRDLRDIVNIRRRDNMVKLLEILAAWSSKFMDITNIGRGLSIKHATVAEYMNALEALYLIERVPPWTKTDYERVGKRDKIFITDTGLMASILKWRFDRVRLDGELNGKLLETLVFTQVAALLDVQDEDYSLYHYRDREKREIDFIIENEDGDLLGLEVKAGSALSADTFKHLRWFSKNLAQGRDFKGVVLYTGDAIASFGDNMWAIPINSLWA